MTLASWRGPDLLDVPFARFSTIGVGGPVSWFGRAESIEDVAGAHAWCAERGVELLVIGGGSNLIVADEGFSGLVLQMAIGGLKFSMRDGDTLMRAGAGESWDGAVAAAVQRGLSGLECLSGIPGRVGGTPLQNVGAYGQEVADTIDQVVCFDRATAATVTLSNAECAFAYRTSRFKQEDAGRFIVCEVSFRLRAGAPTITYPDVLRVFAREMVGTPAVRDVRSVVLEIRQRKGMVLDPEDHDTRSVGSFFMNPIVSADAHARLVAAAREADAPGFPVAGGVKVPAAWLIERAGFTKGVTVGRVGLSTKHPLAIVNRNGATAREIVEFAVRIKRKVSEQFGVWLRPEPVMVGFGADPSVAFLQKASE